MARPKKNTADYFPHYSKRGRTIAALRRNHGNDGYAFWYILSEILTESEGHSLDLSKEIDLEYLSSEAQIEPEKCRAILDDLSRWDKIDSELWAVDSVVWIPGLLDKLGELYRNRKRDIPTKPIVSTVITPDVTGLLPEKPTEQGISTPQNPQSKVEDSIGKKSTQKGKEDLGEISQDAFDRFWKLNPIAHKRSKCENGLFTYAITDIFASSNVSDRHEAVELLITRYTGYIRAAEKREEKYVHPDTFLNPDNKMYLEDYGEPDSGTGNNFGLPFNLGFDN